jgi:hypothetical protein
LKFQPEWVASVKSAFGFLAKVIISEYVYDPCKGKNAACYFRHRRINQSFGKIKKRH